MGIWDDEKMSDQLQSTLANVISMVIVKENRPSVTYLVLLSVVDLD